MAVKHNTLKEENLHVPGYIQDLDPGVIGAGKYWVDTSLGSNHWLLKVRNLSNTGWELVSVEESDIPTLASQAEAEAGTDNQKYMSALRVDQAIQFRKIRSVILTIDGGEISIEASSFDHAAVNVTDDFTLNIPTNGQAGQRISLDLIQDAAGGHAITLAPGWYISSELAEDGIVLSTAADAVDHLGIFCDGIWWYIEAFSTDFSEVA